MPILQTGRRLFCIGRHLYFGTLVHLFTNIDPFDWFFLLTAEFAETAEIVMIINGMISLRTLRTGEIFICHRIYEIVYLAAEFLLGH